MRWLEPLRQILALSIFIWALVAMPVYAVNPDEILEDPKLEQRARELSTIIRCMKCQNQSIDDSDADLARDLRILVRERLVQGDSDTEVLDYLVDRYGEFVLLKPQFNLSNLALWLAPLLALLAGLYLSYRMIAARGSAENQVPEKLSDSEQEQLTKILGDSD